MKTIAVIALILTGCEAENIQARGREERQMYLMKSCIEKGGFPETDLSGAFKKCHWPNKEKK